MNWYTWLTLQAFNVWHDEICAALGIPHPGRNGATGEIDEAAQWTTAYTAAIEVSPTDYRAAMSAEVAAIPTSSPGTPSSAPPEPEPEA